VESEEVGRVVSAPHPLQKEAQGHVNYLGRVLAVMLANPGKRFEIVRRTDSILPTSFARLASRVATYAYMKDGTDRFLATFGPAEYHSADQYRAGEYLNLDLSKAVLSPKRLGPPAEFAPVAVEARTETRQELKPGS